MALGVWDDAVAGTSAVSRRRYVIAVREGSNVSTQNPGPDPDDAPTLDEGGGVPAGDTPPDAGQTSGLSHPQPMPGRSLPVLTFVLVGLLILGIGAFFVARVFALFD